MRQLCTEEKNLLYKNRKNILYNTFEQKHGNNVLIIILGLIIGIFAGIVITVSLDVTPDSIELYLFLCVCLSITFLRLIVRLIGGTKDKNNIFKHYDISINGATVLSVNPKENSFIYAEDNYYDGNGKIAKLSSYLHFSKQLTMGMRLIAVRASDNSYFLMALNEETKNLIPQYPPINYFDPASYPLVSERTLPHPNAVYVDIYPHLLSGERKENVLNKYFRSDTKFYVGMACLLEFIILVLLGTIILCMSLSGIMSTSSDYIMFFSIAVPINILITYLYIKRIKKVRKRIRSGDVYVQQVLFSNYDNHLVGYTPVTQIHIYEYENQMLIKKTYSNIIFDKKTPFGSIVYKYTIGKNTIFSNHFY